MSLLQTIHLLGREVKVEGNHEGNIFLRFLYSSKLKDVVVSPPDLPSSRT